MRALALALGKEPRKFRSFTQESVVSLHRSGRRIFYEHLPHRRCFQIPLASYFLIASAESKQTARKHANPDLAQPIRFAVSLVQVVDLL